MSGVSVGWFDPVALYPDPPALVKAIKKFMAPRLKRTKAWPLAVSSIRAHGRGVGVAYAVVAGHIPVHIDSVGLDDSDGRIFQFVLEVENRPTLIAAADTPLTTPIVLGFAPPTQPQAFRLGGAELKPGQAIHFDITTHYHGITALPVEMISLKADLSPRAVIVQVSGFASDQIGEAVEHAAHWIALDMMASG